MGHAEPASRRGEFGRSGDSGPEDRNGWQGTDALFRGTGTEPWPWPLRGIPHRSWRNHAVKCRCHSSLWAYAVAAVLAFLASTSPAIAGAITTGSTTDP